MKTMKGMSHLSHFYHNSQTSKKQDVLIGQNFTLRNHCTDLLMNIFILKHLSLFLPFILFFCALFKIQFMHIFLRFPVFLCRVVSFLDSSFECFIPLKQSPKKVNFFLRHSKQFDLQDHLKVEVKINTVFVYLR